MIGKLTELLGGKAIEGILGMIDKRIPMSKDQRKQLEYDLAELEVEAEKAQTDSIKARGRFIQALVNAMPLIAWILPVSFAFLILCFLFQFGSDVCYGIAGIEAPIYNIDSRYVELMKTFIEFLFYGKIAGKVSPFHKSDGTTGSKFLDKIYN